MTKPVSFAPLFMVGALALCVSCKDPGPAAPVTNGAGVPPTVSSAASPASPVSPASPASPASPSNGAAHAEIGKPAPDFTLKDTDGKDVSLSALRGKVVVLEWFNPGCPFVNRAHTKGSLNGLAKKHAAEGVAWIAVNSGAPGKQGNALEANVEAKTRFGLDHPIADEDGAALDRLPEHGDDAGVDDGDGRSGHGVEPTLGRHRAAGNAVTDAALQTA